MFFIRKSKIRDHLKKVREAEQARQERIWQKRLDEQREDFRIKESKIRDGHYRAIQEKNKEIERCRDAWRKYQDKVFELSHAIFKMKNLLQSYTINANDNFKLSLQISQAMENAENFILKNEQKINKLLGVE